MEKFYTPEAEVVLLSEDDVITSSTGKGTLEDIFQGSEEKDEGWGPFQ